MRSLPDRWIHYAALAVLLAAAWFSTGFHGPDEHYQVIAFAQASLGRIGTEFLPWEYGARIRSTLLPAVCMAVFRAADGVGIHSPFILAFLLRLLTALLAFAVVRHFVDTVRPLLPVALRHPFLLLSFFLWFLPFQFVRFSGETWSGLFLLLAFAQLLGNKQNRTAFVIAGLSLGLAFLCRPPVLAAAAGLIGWKAFVDRAVPRNLLTTIAAWVLVVLAGIALDSWFYGQLTFTAWNYFRLGILAPPNPAFIEYPWWYYYAWTFKYAIPVFGAAILLAFALVCAQRPRHPLTWLLVPFLLFHMLVPHKELRFLYPLAGLVPYLLILGWESAMGRWPAVVLRMRKSPFAMPAAVLIAFVNLFALVVAVSMPAGYGNAALAEQVAAKFPSGKVQIYYLPGAEEAWRSWIPRFYLGSNVVEAITSSPCDSLGRNPGNVELVVAQGPLPRCGQMEWQFIAPALPKLKQWALKAYEWEDAKPVWQLYIAQESKRQAAE